MSHLDILNSHRAQVESDTRHAIDSRDETLDEIRAIEALGLEANNAYQTYLALSDEASALDGRLADGELKAEDLTKSVMHFRDTLVSLGSENFFEDYQEPTTFTQLDVGVESTKAKVANGLKWLWEKILTIVKAIRRRFKILWETSFGRTRKQMKSIEELLDDISKVTANPNPGNLDIASASALYLRFNDKVDFDDVIAQIPKMQQLANLVFNSYTRKIESLMGDTTKALGQFDPESDDQKPLISLIGKYTTDAFVTASTGCKSKAPSRDGKVVYESPNFLGDKHLEATVAPKAGGKDTLSETVSDLKAINITLEDHAQTRLNGATIKAPAPDDIRKLLVSLKNLCEIMEKHSSAIQKRMSAADKLEGAGDAISKKHGEVVDRDITALLNAIPHITNLYEGPSAKLDAHYKKVVDVATRVCESAIKRHEVSGD